MTTEPNKPDRKSPADDPAEEEPRGEAAGESPEPSPDEAHEAAHGASAAGPADPLGEADAVTSERPPPAPVRESPAAGGARRGGGRLLATLALLVALGAAGAAGYLYYELIRNDQTGRLEAEVQALEGRLGDVDGRLAALDQRQAERLDEFRREQEEARAATERALRESLTEVARQAPPSTAEWRRAEARYLLRIANHRLLMERDVEGALRLLKAADSVLADLDDFSLHEVRARLADEIAALENVEGIDVEGLFLRLEALKTQLDELPLRLPKYVAREQEPAPPDEGFWGELRRELSGMLEFRRLESRVKPLLAPEEAVYLELNLRLMLERAQLAAVRREQLIYEESITTAADWIRDYLDTGKAPVRRMLDELTALKDLDLDQPLPDISGSLNALRDVMRNPA